jgi:DNA-binding response OmpR family regulator
MLSEPILGATAFFRRNWRSVIVPHILLIDDDRDCLTALSNRLRFAFREQSLAVDMADSAATGLIASLATHYDALIVDVLMPGTNGFKFVEQLQRTRPDVPIIMISEWDVKSSEEWADRLGLVACLPKPIEFSMLCALVKEVLEKKHGSFPQYGIRQPHHAGR